LSFNKFKKNDTMIRILLIMLVPFMCLGQITPREGNPVYNGLNEPGNMEIKRKSPFNLDEIKVRWKKAALENCPGVPCPTFSVPGPCSSIVATPTSPSSASVSFVPPTSDGGSAITGYIVTATSIPSAPAKRKSSSVITVTGTASPILVTGLTFGVNYIFSVVATNAAGGSPPITTTTTVTPCTLNTAGTASSSPTLTVNTALTPSITIATTGATGIGTATGLPAGVTAVWSTNVITISGTPTATGTFNYTIPLTGGCGSVNATGGIMVTPAAPFTCGISTVSDIDGNPYNTKLIGTQCWTTTNLKVTKYNDGTLIPDSTTSTSYPWAPASGARTGYDVSVVSLSDYVGTFGFLYNWYAATDSRKLCPAGWHVPTDSDWNKLVISSHSGTTVADTSSTSSTQSTTAGTVLKLDVTNTSAGVGLGWDPASSTPSPGTNTSGFSALPGGIRKYDGSFVAIRIYAVFWSATQFDDNYPWNRLLSSDDGNVIRNSVFDKWHGASVRCLKD
jgi:uncharacterized protein (TIGR02145 family)